MSCSSSKKLEKSMIGRFSVRGCFLVSDWPMSFVLVSDWPIGRGAGGGILFSGPEKFHQLMETITDLERGKETRGEERRRGHKDRRGERGEETRRGY